MNTLAIAPLIMAAICLYSGFYHVGMFVRQRDDRASMAFAIACFAVSLYDIFSFGLYSSHSLFEGVVWQSLQLTGVSLIAISMTGFIYHLITFKSRKLFYFLGIVFLVFFILSLFFNFNFSVLIKHPLIKHVHFGFYEITYYEAEAGIFNTLQMAVTQLVFAYLLVLLIRNYLLLKDKHLMPVILALGVFFIASVNDLLVSSGIFQSIYTLEYSFMVLIIAMAGLLLNKFVDLRKMMTVQLYTDTLTELPNRRKLLVDIDKSSSPFVALINIDSFKEINDFYGNEVGDYVLRETAERLKKMSFQHSSLVYKMHGDEYAILMDLKAGSGECVKEDRLSPIQNIFGKINDANFQCDDIEINVRVTIGVSYYDPSDNKVEYAKNKVLNNADMALKQAKELGKSFAVFNESMGIKKEFEKNLFWAKKLKGAILGDRIKPYYQPIINNHNGKVEKYECLARMIDTDGKVVGPYSFLSIAQRVRLYHHITSAMLRKSFDAFSKKPYEFSVNLSVNDILNEETNHLIRQMLCENASLANRVVFEILESEGVSNYEPMLNFITDIKRYGCKFAIDDFGSGYSNFDHIIKLKVDYIKIDASIIKNLDQDNNSIIIAKMIVNAAKDLGISTIGEFVHSKGVYEKCLEIGVDYSQGYYFGEPQEFIE